MAQGNFSFDEQNIAPQADSDSTVTETSTIDQSDAISCADSCSEADQMLEFVCMADELDVQPQSASFLGKRQANHQGVESADFLSGETVYLSDCRNTDPVPEGSDENHPESSFMPPPSLEWNFEPQSLQTSPQSELSQLVLPPPKKSLKIEEQTNQSHHTMKPPKRP